MPLPRKLARMNKAGLNHVTRLFAGWLPGYAIVLHRGRKSGRLYRTPVNVFRHDGGYRFALTYGADSDWVRNVRAAGEFDITTRGRLVTLTDPTTGSDATADWAPVGVRSVLRRIDAGDYLQCRLQRN
ncbi:nitroreductase family deazaflavin-dependent oxidoreductase [Rhodococcus spelaei]|uniref:Nitroreductase family deazaflavin-dependent oxidoreductase n=1 Tax=Rhodococcus spelaei TaxID=2546320 RepID=A0A541B7T9_9NOCA|nr:nitroreductase family deazaflavin-dependent oxidoreductase [Rhodococcus spelaei]TQF68391.1 nitroreductase family deazaflavin-dependent oxidoreductase [Rhodococcus spelaei]